MILIGIVPVKEYVIIASETQKDGGGGKKEEDCLQVILKISKHPTSPGFWVSGKEPL